MLSTRIEPVHAGSGAFSPGAEEDDGEPLEAAVPDEGLPLVVGNEVEGPVCPRSAPRMC